MKIKTVEKIIVLENGKRFSVGDIVRLKGYEKPEITVRIHDISDYDGPETSICFICEDKSTIYIRIKDIEMLEHISEDLEKYAGQLKGS